MDGYKMSPELAAMKEICDRLEGFNPKTRERMLRYLWDRFVAYPTEAKDEGSVEG